MNYIGYRDGTGVYGFLDCLAEKSRNVDDKIEAADGSTIRVYNDNLITFMRLDLSGDDCSLSLNVIDRAGDPLKYVGYRDGVCNPGDAVAISVDRTGEVLIQVVIPGAHGDTTHKISLADLRELVAKIAK